MIKLIDILKKIRVDESIVKVPQEALSKSGEIYDYVSKNLENLKSKSKERKDDNPYMDSKFKDYFKLKDLKGQDIKVSVGFYDDPKSGGAALDPQKDFLLFNLAFDIDKEFIEDTIEHELVHAMDPKLKDIQIYQSVAKKGGQYGGSKLNVSKSGGKSEFEKNYERYLKSPWEFDAFTTPLVNKLVFNIKKSPNYKNILINLLSDIKTKSIDDVLKDKKYEKIPYFFSKKEWTSENYPSIEQEFKFELEKIKIWSTKPTLYKRFISRLGKELIS